MTERQKNILKILIESYIKTGIPVGSKYICNKLEFPISSATIRNELSILDETGYIFQPHTSAGRVPTNKGYDLYVNTLMKKSELTNEFKQKIDSMLSDAAKDPENLKTVAGQILSDLTGYTAIVGMLNDTASYVKRVELFPMSKKTVLILLITSDGLACSRICRSYQALNDETVYMFEKIIAENIIGTELNKFSTAFLQNIVAKTGCDSLCLSPLISSVFEIVDGIKNNSINIKGQSNLITISDNESEVNAILSFLNNKDKMLPLLMNTSDNINILYGDLIGNTALKPSNLIVAKFKLGNNDIGRLGIIGPTRMKYEEILPGIEYFAGQLGKVMSQAINDLDE